MSKSVLQAIILFLFKKQSNFWVLSYISLLKKINRKISLWGKRKVHILITILLFKWEKKWWFSQRTMLCSNIEQFTWQNATDIKNSKTHYGIKLLKNNFSEKTENVWKQPNTGNLKVIIIWPQHITVCWTDKEIFCVDCMWVSAEQFNENKKANVDSICRLLTPGGLLRFVWCGIRLV